MTFSCAKARLWRLYKFDTFTPNSTATSSYSLSCISRRIIALRYRGFGILFNANSKFNLSIQENWEMNSGRLSFIRASEDSFSIRESRFFIKKRIETTLNQVKRVLWKLKLLSFFQLSVTKYKNNSLRTSQSFRQKQNRQCIVKDQSTSQRKSTLLFLDCYELFH